MNTNKDTNQGFVYCSDQNLQPGDIVLTSDDTITSAIIKSTTGGNFSHAMMMINHLSYIHAITGGVRTGNIQRLRVSTPEHMAVLRLKNKSNKLNEIVNSALKDIAKPYSISNAINAKFKIPIYFESLDSKRYCSQLIALAYKEAGINLVNDPYHCTPNEIKNSSLLEFIELKLTPISEIHVKNYLSQLDSNDPNEELHNITASALDKVTKSTGKTFSSADVISFLKENYQFDECITKIFIDEGYFSHYLTHKNGRFSYRYNSYDEFCNGLNKNDPYAEVKEIKKMADDLSSHYRRLSKELGRNNQNTNLKFVEEMIKLCNNLYDMYTTAQTHCERYLKNPHVI